VKKLIYQVLQTRQFNFELTLCPDTEGTVKLNSGIFKINAPVKVTSNMKLIGS